MNGLEEKVAQKTLSEQKMFNSKVIAIMQEHRSYGLYRSLRAFNGLYTTI